MTETKTRLVTAKDLREFAWVVIAAMLGAAALLGALTVPDVTTRVVLLATFAIAYLGSMWGIGRIGKD
jgi:Sec-independent protein secretion pathway component TatC